jgi:3-hydroxyacyl-CoA dehydrogenase/enoyl-CoA hydratase/3-hydroxybutyryl-CoA epimerase
MSMSPVTLTVDGDGIAMVTIDQPGASMNVIDEGLLDALESAIEQVNSDPSITGAVLASGKADFVAGADLRMIQREMGGSADTAAMLEKASRLSRLLRRIETGDRSPKALADGSAFAKPWVAAITGQCLGGGLELALACHFRVCAPSASLGLPEVLVGLLPGGGGTQRLPRLMGIMTALQILTTGQPLDAVKARSSGIITEIAEDPVEAAKALALANPQTAAPWDAKGFRIPGGAGPLNPAAMQVFLGANAMGIAQSRGNYPAIPAILSAVYEGTNLPFDRALAVENKYFVKLLRDPTAANMIRTLFVNKQAAEKGAFRPTTIAPLDFERIAVLGAGLMGGGIAFEASRAGMEVVLLDSTIEAAERGKHYSEKLLHKRLARGRTTQSEVDAFLARIKPTTDYADLAGVDMIIEAVFEDPAVKADVTARALAVVGPDTVFGSNTSTLPITELQANWSKPENFIGIHFFSPVEKMPLVEIIRGRKTADKAVAMALDFAKAIRKVPIVVNDGRGFYTSRCVIAYCDEGMRMLGEGINPALIENCGRNAGYPMGPLQLADSTAIDLGLKIIRATKAAMGEAYDAGPAHDVAVTMVEGNDRLGVKNAKGFYEYAEGGSKPVRLWPELPNHFPLSPNQPEACEVLDRLLFRQLIECLNCMEEGVLTTPIDGDLGAVFGWGHGPFSGGPFSQIDTIGARAFVDRAAVLARRYGDRFTPPGLIRSMADAGKSFYAPPGMEYGRGEG